MFKIEEYLSKSILNHLTLSIFEKIPEGVLINNNKGKIIYVNKNFENLLGYTAKEIVGLPHKEAVMLTMGQNHNYSEIKSDWDQILAGSEIIKVRRFRHKNGQTVPLQVQAFPLFDEEKRFCGEVLYLKDLHEELLTKLTRYVNSTLSLQEVLDNTAKAVVEFLGLASNTIFLLSDDKTTLHLVTCTVFPSKEEINQVSFKVGEGVSGKVVASLKPAYVENLCQEIGVSEQARLYHGNESCMVYPLICKDEVLGAITFNADTVREFSAKELTLFENIANQVALAIYNAQLFLKLEHLSVTDGLTGLYNHRYFQERLEEELARANRNNSDLSLLMLDVDNFKNYNDTFGHLQGDEVLRKVAHLIQKNVRNFDVVARYGGEEFAVILADCPKEDALNIAERIRANIEEYGFHGRERQPGGKVTISIGASVFDLTKEKNTNLLHDADMALYKAKNAGRNRVEFAQVILN